jgi:malate dehydrogenase
VSVDIVIFMRRKISIFGAGNVGGQTAMIAAYKQLGDIVIWNRSEGTAKGVALDIMESSPIDDFDVNVTGTADYKDTAGSDILVLTAGAPRKEGQSRDDLLFMNAEIVKTIVENATQHSKHAILIVLTNPLDAMVWLAHRVSGFEKQRVIGMAGILDTARFRNFIAQESGVSVEDVDAMVLGGHGDFMIPLASHSSINGMPIREVMNQKDIDTAIERTRKAGEEIIKLEGTSAFFSPAYSLVEIVEAIVKDKKRVLPCAAYLDGEYGKKGIFMGVPVKLGSAGIEKIYELKMGEAEKKEFDASAASIEPLINKLREKYSL